MLESLKTAKERWGGVHEVIDRWLHERQELLVHFFSVQGIDPYAPEDTPIEVKIQAFCQIMVDYLSAGHFEIFEQLNKEAEDFDDGGQQLVSELLPRIEEITQTLLTFNDKYADEVLVKENLEALDGDLERLGQLMADRFEIEDRLIQELHEVHRDKVA